MEQQFLQLLRALHLAAGLLALVVAPLSMAAAKGTMNHRRWGKLFFKAMVVLVVSAITLGIWHLDLLMAMVAVFGFHMTASGYRSLYLKKLHEGQKPGRADMLLQGTAGVIYGGLFLWGGVHLYFGHRDTMTLLFLAFGAIGLLMVLSGLHRFYKRAHDKHEWLYGHMIGFLGGYLTTVAAFSAVNMIFIRPVWLQWLWPLLLGAPLIALWLRYYRDQFNKGKRAKELFQLRIK